MEKGLNLNIDDKRSKLLATAKMAGIWYLLMAISGVLGFLIFHPQVFSANPEQTLSNILEAETVARLRLLLEFVIIVSQALTAIWFYRLFKSCNEWAALATAIWGTVNAIVIMVSAIAMGASIKIALSSQLLENKVLSIDLLSNVISNSWSVGGLFFGLWLIPLGYIITSSKRMPVWLGRTLIIGGVGYLVSTMINYSGVTTGSWTRILTLPATIGEFWMIGYLLIFGIRPLTKED